MTKQGYGVGRRQVLALGAAASLAGRRALADDAPLPAIPPIPEKLKGTGELRIAAYGGTAQDAERKAYFQPFGEMSGVKVHDFPGADLNKVKAMVETGTVEWDVVQLGQGSVLELDRKVGEAIDIYVNNRLVARGEVVVVEDRLGVTMTEIIKDGDAAP